MPALINDPAYDRSRARICIADASAERAFEAAEWGLLAVRDVLEFELIMQTARGPVRACHIPATETTPGIVILFGVETYRGEEKWLLLDADLEADLEERPRVLRRKSTQSK